MAVDERAIRREWARDMNNLRIGIAFCAVLFPVFVDIAFQLESLWMIAVGFLAWGTWFGGLLLSGQLGGGTGMILSQGVLLGAKELTQVNLGELEVWLWGLWAAALLALLVIHPVEHWSERVKRAEEGERDLAYFRRNEGSDDLVERRN